MELQKKQMEEVARLYYEKRYTQSEIAKIMQLSRQTVSKLLNCAIKENIVEIKIHSPTTVCEDLEKKICQKYAIKKAVVCSVSNDDTFLRQTATVKGAVDYLKPQIEKGGQKIALSWGRTIQAFISEFHKTKTKDNLVFPLFGATEQKQSYFLSNELAGAFADKIGAQVKYAWFPYQPNNDEDRELFKKTSYYKNLHNLWNNIDIALLGIGNTEIIQTFRKVFGYDQNSLYAVGDISTHFFDAQGKFLDLYQTKLCASIENLQSAKETIAMASGDNKKEAIIAALRSGIINTLITDEYTAKKLL
ncbi:MAG: helix-turn-helix domain-containing protein [Clostridia bacterium]|nr:helix-turn-helix domain-containing protein [Clostridia bacterium]